MAVKVEELLTAEINQPARYLGNELGAAHKDWDGASVRWVLTYPESMNWCFLWAHHLSNILMPADSFVELLPPQRAPTAILSGRANTKTPCCRNSGDRHKFVF